MAKILEFNTESMPNFSVEHTLYDNRQKMAEYSVKKYKSEVTIIVQMYSDLEKLKLCIDSILKYSSDVDFDLILMIDGSQEGIFEHFKNIEYEHTTIIHNTANKGVGSPWNFVSMDMLSEFVAVVMGDMVVTSHWLSNLLKCMKSDPTIGMVVPVSSNSSNLQCVDLGFQNYEEMQEKAEQFNKSDPTKWEERMRTVAVCPLIRKSALYAIGIPYFDIGFSHNFTDDDQAFRIRRSGYKNIVAFDTWVHHNHYRTAASEEEVKKFNDNIQAGIKDFRQKYYNVDAWEDVNNYISFKSKIEKTDSECPQILGIDTRCGTPILDVKNALRKKGIFKADCYAITENGRYFIDLQSICGANNVLCGNVMLCLDKFLPHSLDYVIIDKYINSYPDPFALITKISGLLKPNGHIYVYLKNTSNIITWLDSLGYINDNDNNEPALDYSYYQFQDKIRDIGGNIRCISFDVIDRINELKPFIEKLYISSLNNNKSPQEHLDVTICQKFAFDITVDQTS